MKPIKVPVIEKEDIEAVSKVMSEGYVNDGPSTRELEKMISEMHNCYAFACSNATVGMTACILSTIGSGPGNALVPDITMIATAHSAIAANKRLYVQDVDENFLMSSRNLDLFKNIDVVMPVAFNGKRIDLSEIAYNFPKSLIIVDAAQSILTSNVVDDRADFTVFSLGAIKNITCGIGGVITTRDKKLADCISRYRDHGRADRGKNEVYNHSHFQPGWNLKISDINSAMAVSQLKRSRHISDKLIELEKKYRALLPFEFLKYEDGEIPWLVQCKIDSGKEINIRKMYTRLALEESLCHNIDGTYMDKYKPFTKTDDWYFLPSSHNLTDEDVSGICKEILGN